MEVAELHAYVEKQFAELRRRIDRIDHVQGNLGNSLNLFIAQEERLKNNIPYLLAKATNVLEDRQPNMTVDHLSTCLNRIEYLRTKILDKLHALRDGDDSEKKNEDNER